MFYKVTLCTEVSVSVFVLFGYIFCQAASGLNVCSHVSQQQSTCADAYIQGRVET